MTMLRVRRYVTRYAITREALRYAMRSGGLFAIVVAMRYCRHYFTRARVDMMLLIMPRRRERDDAGSRLAQRRCYAIASVARHSCC